MAQGEKLFTPRQPKENVCPCSQPFPLPTRTLTLTRTRTLTLALTLSPTPTRTLTLTLTQGNTTCWIQVVEQLKRNGYTQLDKVRFRARVWLGKTASSGGFESLMKQHDADGHTSSTHGTGESGETDQRDQLDIWLDTLILNAKEATRKQKEREDAAAGRKNRDAQAAQQTSDAFGSKDGRRARKAKSGAAASASGTPLPSDFGSAQRSTGSGHSASDTNSWGWSDPIKRGGKFSKHPKLNARPFSAPMHVQKRPGGCCPTSTRRTSRSTRRRQRRRPAWPTGTTSR